MSRVHLSPRALLAIIGALIIVAANALSVVTMSPTEASWSDRVYGSSTFGTHPDAGKDRARGTAAYGSMTYRVANQEDLAKVEVLGKAENSLTGAATGPITRSVRGALLNVPATVDGTVCARSTRMTLSSDACSADPGADKAAAFAQAKSSELSVSSFGLPIVRYAQGRTAKPAIATAACKPGQEGSAGLLDGESVILGRSLNQVEVPIPAANRETSEQRTWGSITYTARLQRTEVKGIGYAKSELRLHVEADGATGDPWILHVILANAECGLSRSIEEKIPQPTATNFRSLGGTASMARVLQQPSPDPADVELAEDEAAATPAGSDDEASAGGTGNATESAPSQTDTPQPTQSTELHAAEPKTEGSEPAPSHPATSEPTEPTSVLAGPQDPEPVRVGREFAVVTREGGELGTARIDDIVRTPGCGVELTLTIRTSAEAGPDRWASIGPGDFAEVRPGGSIRKAGRVSPDCERAANSRVTALSAGREYEVVIAIALDDSAQRAMLRPDGTAGWMFDLPPLPKDAATTSPSASAPTSSPATAPSEPGIESLVPTAEA